MHFLFRVELGEPDPERADLVRYTSWEMASRLSYLITDSPPDEKLVQAASANALRDVDRLRAEALRLMGDERARQALVRFFRDFMNIGKLDDLEKSPDKFPAFSATIGPAMRHEMERMFESLVFDQWSGDVRRLFTTRTTFVNEELAKLYGIEGVRGPDFVRCSILATPARALLTALRGAGLPLTEFGYEAAYTSSPITELEV